VDDPCNASSSADPSGAVAQIKARARLSEVCESLGIEHNKRAWKCFAHDDHTPSATIFRERFKCFACGFSADVFGVVSARLGVDFRGALRWLAGFYGVPLTGRHFTRGERRAFAQAKREAIREARRFTEWRRKILASLLEARNAAWEAEQLACRLGRDHFNDPSLTEKDWDATWEAVMMQSRGDEFNRMLNAIESAPVTMLIALWKQRRAE
jgi:hypothetical protein